MGSCVLFIKALWDIKNDSFIKTENMKDKLILMAIVLITMISCNQTGNDNAKKAAYF